MVMTKLKKLKKKQIVAQFKYANGEGFVVAIGEAPKDAKTKADVIRLYTVKRNRHGKLAESSISYYTPDEAMAISIGLLRAVDYVMAEHWLHFRSHKDTSL
jgi:hypothetical protein